MSREVVLAIEFLVADGAFMPLRHRGGNMWRRRCPHDGWHVILLGIVSDADCGGVLKERPVMNAAGAGGWAELGGQLGDERVYYA